MASMSIGGARYSILVALVCVGGVVPPQTLAQGRLADRVLTPTGRGDAVFLASPKPSGDRLRMLLMLIARSARVPIGFEEVAGIPLSFADNLSTIPSSDRTVLVGLTVGEALDALISADPRYSWREQDGVILIRPLDAWTDPVHFLHQPFPGTRLRDSTASDVARALYSHFGVRIIYGEGGVLGDPPPDTDSGLEKRLTFDLPWGTTIDALNAVVRAHGGLGWVVRYARAPADIKSSCLRFVTFGGRFSGVGAAGCASVRTGSGKPEGGASNTRMEPTRADSRTRAAHSEG